MYSSFSAISPSTPLDSPTFVPLFFIQLTSRLIPNTRKGVKVPGDSQNGKYFVFLPVLWCLTVPVKSEKGSSVPCHIMGLAFAGR